MIIVGQSGTGKTLATSKLYEELREEIPGLARIRITKGPKQLRDDTTLSPVLYDIEDPWGRFDFDPDSRPWNDQLARFFSHATHDRMIVATTRLDVAQSAGIRDSVNRWVIPLEAEHYGNQERLKLYETRIERLPREQQALVKKSVKTVLAELRTPLEIQKFFDALPLIDRQEFVSSRALISEAINLAHQDSIERTVIDQIEQRDDIRAATIIWALLKANDKIAFQVLRRIEEGLAEKEEAHCKGVSPLTEFFVAARNLRQSEDVVNYYHPRVESGILQTLRRQKHFLIVRRTLRQLVDVLISLEGPDETWGTGTGARIVAAASKEPQLKLIPSSDTQAMIDSWLTNLVSEGGKDLEANLQLAAAAGSTQSNVSEVARYLLNRTERNWPGFVRWGPPPHDEAWYERVGSDPIIKPVIENFIREVLINTNDSFPCSFVYELEKIVPELSGAFLDAASRAVQLGVIHSADAIAEGALIDLNSFESIVDAAVKELTPSEEEKLLGEEQQLAIVNKVYSEEYAQYLSESEDGYTVSA